MDLITLAGLCLVVLGVSGMVCGFALIRIRRNNAMQDQINDEYEYETCRLGYEAAVRTVQLVLGEALTVKIQQTGEMDEPTLLAIKGLTVRHAERINEWLWTFQLQRFIDQADHSPAAVYLRGFHVGLRYCSQVIVQKVIDNAKAEVN